MLSRCFLDCSVGVGVFVTGLSQISSFFSWNSTPGKGGIHMYFFNDNLIIWWIPLLDRGVLFFRISGKRVSRAGAMIGTIKTLRNVYGIETRSYVHLLLQSACTSMCCLKYDWNIFDCDVKQKRLSSIQHCTCSFKFASFMYLNISFFVFLSVWQFLPLILTTRACTGHGLVVTIN